MKCQSAIYYKDNPCVTTSVINYGFTIMSKGFAVYLRAKLDELNMKPAELARRAGTTKQNIGRILNQTRHPLSNALPKVKAETVEKIANALGVDVSEALHAAGYAGSPKKPTNAAEFLEALAALGIPDFDFVGNVEGIADLSPDAYQDLLESVKIAVEISLRRTKR